MLERTRQGEHREPGTVIVEVDVKAPPPQVWDALTEPAIVRRWFGELSAQLKDGASSRLDFGDGDFFMIEGVTCRAPERLAYFWRFQGTGPRDTVIWDVMPIATGSRVRVTDNEPSRSAKVVDELFEGWTDFLGRLQRHIATGETARYDWRREFSSAAELPGTPEQNRGLLTHLDAMNAWMPFRANGLTKNGAVGMTDGLAPQRLMVSNFKRGTGTSMSFGLRAGEWRSPTICRIEIVPHASGSLLVVTHAGWEDIGQSGEYQKNQRHRFGDHWVESMRRVVKVAAKSLR